MGESTKAVCTLVMIIGVFAAVFGWSADRPTETEWGLRIGGPAAASMAIIIILALHFRADLAHDYLRPITGSYFNRDGFCFALVATAVDGIAYLDVYFQTQFDRPCQGRIAVRPARGFFLTRAKIDTITFDIDCPAAGFGFVRFAIPVPAKLQGKKQSFEVGASASHPEGKGKRLRFHDGVFLRTNSNFSKPFGTAALIAGAATASIPLVALAQPVTTSVALPSGVAEEIPENLEPVLKILWKLGDSDLVNNH